ncbi:MAG: hypothetical protein HPY57_14170 [Ignavibacteria bacterium]|nr:hypothetical protein [Ignavibacteria bacterium]
MILSKAYTYILVPIISYLAPISGLFHLMLFLVFLDLITALIRDWKIKKARTIKQKIRRVKSKKLRRTLVKLFLYIMFIIATYSIPKICFNNTFYLAELMTSFISIIELKSISENMDIINESDIFTTLFKKIRNFLSSMIEKKIDNPK